MPPHTRQLTMEEGHVHNQSKTDLSGQMEKTKRNNDPTTFDSGNHDCKSEKWDSQGDHQCPTCDMQIQTELESHLDYLMAVFQWALQTQDRTVWRAAKHMAIACWRVGWWPTPPSLRKLTRLGLMNVPSVNSVWSWSGFPNQAVNNCTLMQKTVD